MSSGNKEDYIWALQRAYNLLRADHWGGALGKLPAGGIECEELVERAVAVIKEALEPDDIPKPSSDLGLRR